MQSLRLFGLAPSELRYQVGSVFAPRATKVRENPSIQNDPLNNKRDKGNSFKNFKHAKRFVLESNQQSKPKHQTKATNKPHHQKSNPKMKPKKQNNKPKENTFCLFTSPVFAAATISAILLYAGGKPSGRWPQKYENMGRGHFCLKEMLLVFEMSVKNKGLSFKTQILRG